VCKISHLLPVCHNHTAEKNSAQHKLPHFLFLFLSRFSEENTHFDDAMESIAGLGDSFRDEQIYDIKLNLCSSLLAHFFQKRLQL